uniref:Uncharacterized protein n=1 Tax=Arundo donax TaxID=35708 RepID=A0A0A8ZID3_ARUDO
MKNFLGLCPWSNRINPDVRKMKEKANKSANIRPGQNHQSS